MGQQKHTSRSLALGLAWLAASRTSEIRNSSDAEPGWNLRGCPVESVERHPTTFWAEVPGIGTPPKKKMNGNPSQNERRDLLGNWEEPETSSKSIKMVRTQYRASMTQAEAPDSIASWQRAMDRPRRSKRTRRLNEESLPGSSHTSSQGSWNSLPKASPFGDSRLFYWTSKTHFPT